MTTAVDITTTTSIAVTTSTITHHEDGHGDEEEEHTDAADTGTIGPSPTDSVGCEPHGDHWDCEGPATPTGTGTAAPSFVTTTSRPAGPAPTTSATQPVATAGAARYEVTRLGFAGIAAVAAAALV